VSGLLRRLASRALGVTPTVRPVVGWTAEAESRTTAQAPALTFESGIEPETAPRRNAGDPPSRAAAEIAPSTSVEQLLPGRTASTAMELDVLAPSKHLRPPFPVDAAEARAAPPAASSGSTPPAAPPTAGAGFDDPRPAPVHRTDASRASTHDEPPDAPLLLPPQRVGRALPAPVNAGASPLPAGPARSASEETTEVHVTIGRIEVTAVQEAPRPRREPARSRKPKSLEEYLAGRQGRRA
jgi:hypothetical protein